MSPRKAAALRNSDDARGLREHLVATAQRLMAEQGTAGLTVRGIARAAGVADGVLYNYFSDKEELLAAAVRAHVAAAHRNLGPLPAAGDATVEENLRHYLRAGLALHSAVLPIFAGLLTSPAILARFEESVSAPESTATEPQEGHALWHESLSNYLGGELELGRLAPGADIESAVALLVGICHDQVLSALLPGAPATRATVDSVVATLLEGIGP
ncbi:TetR/AcrR family transcriptional regulator [Nocardia sp. NPDC088792]|uniref:TetR/AcrR family transcriptional regulator n=1 Tax=Nocardia sp. NPDC088792 TaxID=3364332 RepID=UPI00382A99D7